MVYLTYRGICSYTLRLMYFLGGDLELDDLFVPDRLTIHEKSRSGELFERAQLAN